MATGDISDWVRRLRAALPARWFPDSIPVLTGVLTGFAAVWASLYALLAYVIQQSRIATASGVFLDMIALDFFQGRITRRASEPDTHFRLRIQAEILRPRATRGAVSQALTDLTGVAPTIFEPANATDTGGYNSGGVGYNVAGGWGDLGLPFQAFITAYRPAGGGIANVSGYGNLVVGINATGGIGGYGQGAIEWASLSMIRGAITDADIYATVAAAMPAATIGWTRGLSALPSQQRPVLLPAGGFSRTISSARAVMLAVAGALMRATGSAASAGRMAINSSTTSLIGGGVGAAFGRIVPQSGILVARGVSVATGRINLLSGGGILMAFGKSRAQGPNTLTGRAALSGRGIATAAGMQIYGNVVILGGRGGAELSGKSVVTAKATLMTGRGTADGAGRNTMTLAGGANLVVRGFGRGSGRSAAMGLAAALRNVSRSSGSGIGVMTLVQAVPSAPTNLTASNDTPTTVTLTWSPSTGGP